MLKSSSLVLFLYTFLISIFSIRNQNTNRLKVLNDKPFPIYLSSSKNATHYFIITTEESLCIEIKTGNIKRISPKKDSYFSYKSYCLYFTDLSNNDYIYCDHSSGYFRINCYMAKFVSSSIRFYFESVPSIIGSMKDINDVILYGYRTNIIYFLFINNKISPYKTASLKTLTSCKILKNYVKYLCTCNSENDKIILYIISYYTQINLFIDKHNDSISELVGYIDSYLYDTLNLTTKILCAKNKDNTEVNCWICKISLIDNSNELYKISEISFNTYKYYENICCLDVINSIYLFCCGGINLLTCFQMDQDFNFINKDELNINGNISYVSIINEENILNIIFMSQNQNNYRSYMYDFSSFSFISEILSTSVSVIVLRFE